MTTFSPARRRVLAAVGAAALAGCAKWSSQGPELGPIAAMFPGSIDDGGFMQAGYEGLLRIERELGIPVTWLDRIEPTEEAMQGTLRALADSDAKLVVAHGGLASQAVQRVAWEFPEQRFVSIQGHLTRPNLAVYEVLQEQSAWLAGAAAGLLTRTNVVGHVSGPRVRPGLKARAAFAAGLASTNGKAKLLSSFTGAQDDAGLAQRVALAQIDAGADLLFTMLDAGRAGAIEASRARGVRQIGNVVDWVQRMPDVFVGSAIADPGYALFQAGRDLRDNLWSGELVKRFGTRYPDAVRLSLAPGVPAPVTSRLAALGQDMALGRIEIPDAYAGPEFAA